MAALLEAAARRGVARTYVRRLLAAFGRPDRSVRVDQTLIDASNGWAQAPRRMSPPANDEGPNPGRPPSNFYVRGIGPDGRVWMAVNDGEKASPIFAVDRSGRR